MPNNIRTTQQYVEAAVTREDTPIRVTQQYVEAACYNYPVKARVTQMYVEAAYLGDISEGSTVPPCVFIIT